MLIVATFKALRDLMLPGVLKIFFWCMLAYIAGLSALIWGLSWLIDRFVTIPQVEGFFADALSVAGGLVLGWFLFPLLYPVLVSFFDEQMAEIIDEADYPQLPKAEQPFWPTLGADVLFTLKAVALNIICLPVLIVPVLGLVFYYGLNGYLLGTQFFRMAAGRRLDPAATEKLRKDNFGSILLTGICISFMATIPVINLAAPILGVAVTLHLFYLLHAKQPTP